MDTSTYVNTDGTKIAIDFANLLKENLKNPIKYDEEGNSVGGFVWSSTGMNGTRVLDGVPGYYCNDWAGGNYAFYGDANATDSSWYAAGDPSPCDHDKRHYCIQR